MEARPILKWAGGKWRLRDHMRAHVPAKVRTYAEPFVGGAALFFALSNDTPPRFARAVLADANEELIVCYRVVRDRVEELIQVLQGYRYDRDVFYETRDLDPLTLGEVERAARFVFLNRTCFNGLWRVNASGKFNVPFGRYANPKIVQKERLRAASAALAGVELRTGDFLAVTRELTAGDFVYFDPPYVPISRTSDFTAYSAGGFDDKDQERLRDELARLRQRNVFALLSNADTPETRALYQGFAMRSLEVHRSINADASKRGPTSELLVANWEAPGLRVAGARARPRRRA